MATSSEVTSAAADAARPTRVFISYSRKDAAIADDLARALSARGFEAYLDKKDILPGEPWQDRIGALIQSADAVVFLVSPDSVASPVCSWEVEEAERQRKRIIPVVHRACADEAVPRRLARLNYIFLRDEDDRTFAIDTLAAAIDIDIGWIRQHTRLGELATRWNEAARPSTGGRLLRGEELVDAERWLLTHVKSSPEPTPLQRDFVRASRDFETAELARERAQIARTLRFQKRSAWALAGIAVLLSAMLGAVLWQDYQTKVREQAVFTGAADAAIRDENYEYAMRLALQASPPPGATVLTPHSAALEAKLTTAAMMSRLLAFRQEKARPKNWIDGNRTGTMRAAQRDDDTVEIWDMRAGNLVRTLSGVGGALRSVDFDAQTKRAVTAGGDGTVRVWDIANGRQLLQVSIGPNVATAAFSPDGRRIVANVAHRASEEASLQLWDAETGERLALVARARGELSPDGTKFVVATGDQWQLWDQDLKAPIIDLAEPGKQRGVPRFSPAGKFIVSLQPAGIVAWNVNTAQPVADINVQSIGEAGRIIVSPTDDRVLVTSGPWGGWLFDLKSGAQITTLQVNIAAAIFSPDSRRIATSSPDGTRHLWSRDGERLAVLHEDDDLVDWLFSADGRKLTTLSAAGEVRDWNADVRTNVRHVPHLPLDLDTSVPGIALAEVQLDAAGRRVVALVDDGRTPVIWDAATLQEVGRINVVNMSTMKVAGQRIVTLTKQGSASLWDTERGLKIADLDMPAGGVASVAISHDGAVVATTSMSGEISLWNRDGRPMGPLIRAGTAIGEVYIGPRGKRIATVASGNTMKLWDVATARALEQWQHDDGEAALTFDPSGTFIVHRQKEAVSLRQTSNGAEATWAVELIANARDAIFSSDGQRLAVMNASGVTIVDVPVTANDPSVPPRHVVLPLAEPETGTMTFNSDGTRLFATNADALMVWDAQEGRALFEIPNRGVLQATLTPDGRRVIAAYHGDRLRVWDVAAQTAVLDLGVPTERLSGLQIAKAGARAVATGFDRLTVFDLSWTTQLAGDQLWARVCAEKLQGVQSFTDQELRNAVLTGLEKSDAIARNPCLRRGAWHLEYYTQTAKQLIRKTSLAVRQLQSHP